MHTYHDTVALMAAVTTETDGQLQGLIARRIQDLAEYADFDLAELLHILVIEPSDALTDVDAELGFSLADRPWDVLESSPDWYELTLMLSDDGFGVVLYVPKRPDTDTELLGAVCKPCQGASAMKPDTPPLKPPIEAVFCCPFNPEGAR